MSDVNIAKEHLLKNNLNLVIVKDENILEESNSRGIKPIYEAHLNRKESFKEASVADRVIGKAAAMFLVSGGIKALYTDLISEPALEILNNNNIEVEYLKKVPMILNRMGNDMCPIERLSSQTNEIDKLTENISIFLSNLKAN